MYLAAKFIEALGLGIVLIGFLRNFPKLMNPHLLAVGVSIFFCGWMIERFLLKHR